MHEYLTFKADRYIVGVHATKDKGVVLLEDRVSSELLLMLVLSPLVALDIYEQLIELLVDYVVTMNNHPLVKALEALVKKHG